MIYLDMDGVIADFFTEVAARFNVDHWKSIQDKEVKFTQLAYTDFFYTIPKFYEDETHVDLSSKIVNYVKTVAWDEGIEWGICSSPLRGDEHNSAYWKRLWLEFQGFMPKVENCIFTANKHKFAYSSMDHKPNILIDDKPDNIRRFRAAGGIGILFQANEDDFESLQFEIQEAMKEREER